MTELKTVIEDHGSRWQLGLMQGDVCVSGVAVVKKQMQIGSATVKMGGIGGVWTHADHRKKGYASRMMWEAIALMARERYELSILFGIADFYHRYGYAVAFAEQSMSISTQALRRLSGPHDARSSKPVDILAMRRLYRQYNAGRSGMDARGVAWSPRWYMPRLGEGTTRRAGKVLVVCDGRDRVCGFAVYDAQAGRMVVAEVCGLDHKARTSLAAALSRRAQRAGVEQVRFCLPIDDPFVDLCIPLGCSCQVGYPHNAGAMGRIVLLKPLMHALLPVLEMRAIDAGLRCELDIETDSGSVGLRVGPSGAMLSAPGSRSRVKLGQMALTQLVMGYRRAADVACDDGVEISKRLLPELDVLFPKGNPYMWWTDRF